MHRFRFPFATLLFAVIAMLGVLSLMPEASHAAEIEIPAAIAVPVVHPTPEVDSLHRSTPREVRARGTVDATPPLIALSPFPEFRMMRAKMQIQSIEQFAGGAERLKLTCVSGSKPYGPEGESEDNTFARFSPSGELGLTITNPALRGKFAPGQKFYLDFTPAE